MLMMVLDNKNLFTFLSIESTIVYIDRSRSIRESFLKINIEKSGVDSSKNIVGEKKEKDEVDVDEWLFELFILYRYRWADTNGPSNSTRPVSSSQHNEQTKRKEKTVFSSSSSLSSVVLVVSNDWQWHLLKTFDLDANKQRHQKRISVRILFDWRTLLIGNSTKRF